MLCIRVWVTNHLRLFAVIFVVSISSATLAQNHELAVTFGGQIPVNASFDIDPGFAIQGSYAGRLLHVPLASIYFEFPVVVGLKNEGLLPSFSGLERREYSSLFIAPGLKLKLAPEFPVSPYFTLGGGLARFKLDATANSPEQTRNTSVIQFGAGLDMKIAPFISLRGEVRDFYSGSLLEGPAALPGGGSIAGRQHNIVPSAGLVLRF